MLIAWAPTLHVLSCKVAFSVLFLAMVMFPHELKIQAFLIIYCHWERCFGRLPVVSLSRLWSTHLSIYACAHTWNSSCQSCHGRSRLRRWFIHKRLSFNYSQIRSHGYPGGPAALQRLWAIASEPRVESQTARGSPQLSLHVNGISISSARTKEISTHPACQSLPNKPVYVLNTVGTLGIPDRHCYRQVITAITPSY